MRSPAPHNAYKGLKPSATAVVTAICGGEVSLVCAETPRSAGSAVLSGAVDLAGAAADLKLTLRPAVSDPPELGLRLVGPLDALRRTPELADLIRWRAAHPGP
jgi:hypothetical protein